MTPWDGSTYPAARCSATTAASGRPGRRRARPKTVTGGVTGLVPAGSVVAVAPVAAPAVEIEDGGPAGLVARAAPAEIVPAASAAALVVAASAAAPVAAVASAVAACPSGVSWAAAAATAPARTQPVY